MNSKTKDSNDVRASVVGGGPIDSGVSPCPCSPGVPKDTMVEQSELQALEVCRLRRLSRESFVTLSGEAFEMSGGLSD